MRYESPYRILSPTSVLEVSLLVPSDLRMMVLLKCDCESKQTWSRNWTHPAPCRILFPRPWWLMAESTDLNRVDIECPYEVFREL